MKIWLVVEQGDNTCHVWHVGACERPTYEDWQVLRQLGEIPDTDDEEQARDWWPALSWIEYD